MTQSRTRAFKVSKLWWSNPNNNKSSRDLSKHQTEILLLAFFWNGFLRFGWLLLSNKTVWRVKRTNTCLMFCCCCRSKKIRMCWGYISVPKSVMQWFLFILSAGRTFGDDDLFHRHNSSWNKRVKPQINNHQIGKRGYARARASQHAP